jgi:uncharacterized protein
MTPEEHDMIEGVFERMRSMGRIEKDPEAETFINTSVRKIPDSAYMLVQSVLVQEQALQQSEARMQELEAQVADLQAQLPRSTSASGGGGFLGGLFGGSKPAPAQQTASPWGGSVPPVGRQSAGYSGPGQSGGSTLGNQAPQQGGYAQAPMQQAPQRGGGGFMKSAMATATGVAGGMLVAGAIGNMMKGHGEGGAHHTSGDGADSGPTYQDASSNDQGGTYAQEQQPQYQEASDNDQGSGIQDADANDDDGGGWASGGDIET